MRKKISIVSPVYRTGKILPDLISQIKYVLDPVNGDFEIILIDDGCPENSWSEVEKLTKADKRIKGIRFSRNFGQHQAVSAGLEASEGDYIVIMDSDLQDDPKLIIQLLQEMDKGFDVVYTIRKKRKQAFLRSMISQFYTSVFNLVADKNFDINYGSLMVCNRQVCNNFLKLKDKERLYIQLFKWLGFNAGYVAVDHHERHEGKSSYTYADLAKIALQGLTTHSTKLLRLSIMLGFTLSILSFLGVGLLIFLYFFMGFQAGWPSIVVTILFSTGLIQLSIGFAGIYIGKTFEQVKDRPLFIIKATKNMDNEQYSP